MLHSLSPLSDNSLAGGVVQVPAPPKFKGVVGTVQEVGIGGSSPLSRGKTAAQKAGLRYEAKVQDFLAGYFSTYVKSPYIRFRDGSGMRMCIPDGLLCFLPTRAVIFEIKHLHTPDAWWQLKKLYEPVILAAGYNEVQVVEICKSYDAATPFPCKVELLDTDNLRSFALQSPPAFGVLPWTP